MEPLIRMVGITKTFPGVKALDNISFDILPGEVHVLIGENGAGKSTLMKILSGVYQPTSGQFICNGRTYDALTTKASQDEGIAIVYQELSVINELSILENLFVGKLPTKKVMGIPVAYFTPFVWWKTGRCSARASGNLLMPRTAQPMKGIAALQTRAMTPLGRVMRTPGKKA